MSSRRTAQKANFGLKFVLADAGVSYQLVKAGEEHPFLLAGTLGLRYWYTDTLPRDQGAGRHRPP